ncbi:MAG: hypothetical protein OMOMHJEC_03204 [Xanthomonadales bacterium]|nr:hypothetical protein [Xanthomonadales bacterium]
MAGKREKEKGKGKGGFGAANGLLDFSNRSVNPCCHPNRSWVREPQSGSAAGMTHAQPASPFPVFPFPFPCS